MYKDDLILGDLYLESTQVSNLTPDQQQKLTSFVVDLVVKSEQGDEEALKMLAMSPEELVASLESQTGEVQTEAFENIRSKVGGYFGGTGSIQKRYEFLTTNLSKILWELSEDIKTTRSEEAISKYNALQSQLVNLDPALTPAPGTFQKAAYSVGKGVGAVGKVLAAGALAKSLLTVGLPIVAVGGIMGGVISVLKNAQNTRMTTAEKIKKALVSVGLGAMTAFAMGELRDLVGGDNISSTQDSNQGGDVDRALGMGEQGKYEGMSGGQEAAQDYINKLNAQLGRSVNLDISGDNIIAEVKVKIPESLGQAKGIIRADQVSNSQAAGAIAKAIGTLQPDGSYTATINGIQKISREIVDGYVVTKYSAPINN
jgi:hypothetical protein